MIKPSSAKITVQLPASSSWGPLSFSLPGEGFPDSTHTTVESRGLSTRHCQALKQFSKARRVVLDSLLCTRQLSPACVLRRGRLGCWGLCPALPAGWCGCEEEQTWWEANRATIQHPRVSKKDQPSTLPSLHLNAEQWSWMPKLEMWWVSLVNISAVKVIQNALQSVTSHPADIIKCWQWLKSHQTTNVKLKLCILICCRFWTYAFVPLCCALINMFWCKLKSKVRASVILSACTH